MDGINNDVLQNLGLAANENLQTAPRSNDDLGISDYLNLMIAQIQNQDPFEPMENGQFISQLAEFGTVSGIEELQQSFAGFSESMFSNQALQAASLVGRVVQVPQNVVSLQAGVPVTGAVDLEEGAAGVRINISDLQGNLVQTMDLGSQGAGSVEFVWDGTNLTGQSAPPGSYQITAQALANNEAIALNTFIDERVESVALGGAGQQISLSLASGDNVSFQQVRLIR